MNLFSIQLIAVGHTRELARFHDSIGEGLVETVEADKNVMRPGQPHFQINI